MFKSLNAPKVQTFTLDKGETKERQARGGSSSKFSTLGYEIMDSTKPAIHQTKICKESGHSPPPNFRTRTVKVAIHHDECFSNRMCGETAK